MPKKEKSEDKVKLVLLRSTSDEYELNLIKGLLDEAGIPFIIKEPGSSGYMRIIGGTSVFGSNVYVDASSFKEAEEILSSFELDEIE